MSDFVSAAVELAQAAGALLLSRYEQRIAVEYKGDVDLVTAADRASEQLIVNGLRQRYPAHAILAEEGSGREAESEYRWFIDPLDGTTNFAHGFPFFCVSIGLARRGELIAGAVHDPVRHETFTAERGGGAFLNGRPLRVSPVADLGESLVATGFPTHMRHKNTNIHFYYQVNMRSHGVRRAGSAALDLCYVAAGRMEAFWEFGLKPWDVAAGSVVLKEAGGRISDMHGAPHSVDSPHVLASNGLVHDSLLHIFDRIFHGEDTVPMPTI